MSGGEFGSCTAHSIEPVRSFRLESSADACCLVEATEPPHDSCTGSDDRALSASSSSLGTGRSGTTAAARPAAVAEHTSSNSSNRSSASSFSHPRSPARDENYDGGSETSQTRNKESTASFEARQPVSVFELVGKPILAGALTGAIECTVTYPTEYVKTHLQLQNKQHPRYTGMMDCVAKTIRESGFLGLYRGMMPLLLGSIPKQASRWGTYEASCAAMLELKRRVFHIPAQRPLSKMDLTMSEVAVCGFIAGSVEALVAVVPTETIKTVLIDDQKLARPRFARRSLWYVCRTLVAEEGFRGIYRGVSNTVSKQGLNQCTRFPAQLAALNSMCGSDESKRRMPLYNGAAGFVAGAVSVVVTQPFDVVKTKMQGTERHLYLSSADCWIQTARRNGLTHFYAGSMARVVRVGGNVALTFTLFPLLKNML